MINFPHSSSTSLVELCIF